MTDTIPGIHHVTSIASDPRENVDFYTEVLGLRLVKRTVNFDDKFTYHLYYGDETGTPGTILTFFPFVGATRGTVGVGQASATAFVVPPDAIDYWLDRLDDLDVDRDDPEQRFDETVIPLRDHDGQPLELVAGESSVEPWAEGPVLAEYAIRGFHGVTLHSADPESTAAVLETMGYEREASDGDRVRYRAPGDRASVVDLLAREGPRGRQGVGTVHHVAFRTATDETQREWRERLTNAGLSVTPVKDRQYFRSIYFREPGGVLFEIATDAPGFTRDEDAAELGSDLKLPPWLEADRETIEKQLPPISTRGETA
ncbi:ring-cleaving dioxygenase [Halomarina halobia]|uniref:Ring-cleaving dioxygenase n=1 Tax=Halomarina halobia TaxID=3033386 RepID=A0ABD6AA55_9EURY|nr:ring-cleaving dioxygenase [Halomarina sp. PSR21]